MADNPLSLVAQAAQAAGQMVTSAINTALDNLARIKNAVDTQRDFETRLMGAAIPDPETDAMLAQMDQVAQVYYKELDSRPRDADD